MGSENYIGIRKFLYIKKYGKYSTYEMWGVSGRNLARQGFEFCENLMKI